MLIVKGISICSVLAEADFDRRSSARQKTCFDVFDKQLVQFLCIADDIFVNGKD